jgi:hypothetical protein
MRTWRVATHGTTSCIRGSGALAALAGSRQRAGQHARARSLPGNDDRDAGWRAPSHSPPPHARAASSARAHLVHQAGRQRDDALLQRLRLQVRHAFGRRRGHERGEGHQRQQRERGARHACSGYAACVEEEQRERGVGGGAVASYDTTVWPPAHNIARAARAGLARRPTSHTAKRGNLASLPSA